MPLKNVILVLDTETADLSGSVYDVGYVIADKNGNILTEYNALVEEVFTNPDKMFGAFYAKKLFSHYAPMLDNSEISIRPWAEIVGKMNSNIEKFGVTTIAAYNAAFDFRVMASTHKMLGFNGRVLKSGLKTLDLWRFACETKLSQKTYIDLARNQGWVSDAGNIKTGAEYAYRYARGDWGFIEDHTALSDARIEAEIMAACYATKKAVPYNEIGGQPWRIVKEAAA